MLCVLNMFALLNSLSRLSKGRKVTALRSNALPVLYIILSLSPLFANAQTSLRSATSDCSLRHKLIAPTGPRMTANGDFVAGQAIVQARMKLDANTSLRIVEYPQSLADVDAYNSVIIVRRGQQQTRYPLSGLIQHGSILRLVEFAALCTAPDAGVVFFAFETASTGAEEGFAVIRYSPEAFTVQGFPGAIQGRIVLNKDAPYSAEMWSASGEPKDKISCDACPKYYRVEDCQIGPQKLECQASSRRVGPYLPDHFMQARIKIR